MTNYAPFKFECDCGCGHKRKVGDIGAFLMEHEPNDKSYCFDCVEVRSMFRKNTKLEFKEGHHERDLDKM